jgi:hypothetical protein
LLIRVRGQIKCNLLRTGTLASDAKRNLFSATGGIANVDGNLLGAGAAAAGTQVQDNFGTGYGTRIYRRVQLSVPALQLGLQRRKGLLRTSQITRLQSLTDVGESLLALAAYEGIPVGFGALLAQRNNFVISALRSG